jgi:hypothetical protein
VFERLHAFLLFEIRDAQNEMVGDFQMTNLDDGFFSHACPPVSG